MHVPTLTKNNNTDIIDGIDEQYELMRTRAKHNE